MNEFQSYQGFATATYPQFYNHPLIKKIATNERWSISDNAKKPTNMTELLTTGRIVGANINAAINPCIDLNTLITAFPTATNHAYYLDYMIDSWLVVDIEPKCPINIKNQWLNTNYAYGEISLSGHGYHLIFTDKAIIDSILLKYPAAQTKSVMKEEHKYYEILMNHWVTFTRNMIPTCPNPDDTLFASLFETIASQQTVRAEKNIDISNFDMNIPKKDEILEILCNQTYRKTVKDFEDDYSTYEYMHIVFLHDKLKMILNLTRIKKQHTYTDNEKALLLYEAAKEVIPYRNKHDQQRDNLPWLLYLTKKVLGKSS